MELDRGCAESRKKVKELRSSMVEMDLTIEIRIPVAESRAMIWEGHTTE